MDADAELFEADSADAADSGSKPCSSVGDAEFDADATCQAGVSDANEGDDDQSDDVDSCNSDATQRGVKAEAELLEADSDEAANSDSDVFIL